MTIIAGMNGVAGSSLKEVSVGIKLKVFVGIRMLVRSTNCNKYSRNKWCKQIGLLSY